MNEEKIMAVIEAVLFAMGDSVELSKLQHVLEIPEEEIRGMIQLMNETYKRQDRGIYIMELENAVQLCTKPELYEYLIRVAKAPRKYVLSDTLLETLSIIAYKQPVTKLEVEKILLFGTTEEFLRTFGVKSLGDLPVLNQDQVEDFRKQAEEEAGVKVEV